MEWPGDRLIVTGKLETPPIFDGFSYKDYMLQYTNYLRSSMV